MFITLIILSYKRLPISSKYLKRILIGSTWKLEWKNGADIEQGHKEKVLENLFSQKLVVI